MPAATAASFARGGSNSNKKEEADLMDNKNRKNPGEDFAPHPPANMLDLYMTRYDYDYNRDPALEASKSAADGAGDGGESMSGDVRNRPIFAHGAGEWEGNTIYRQDYLNPDGRPRARALQPGETAYRHEWFRPELTPAADVVNENDGEKIPLSVYRRDYKYLEDRPQGAGGKGTGDDGAPLYAGARAAAYDPDFLRVKTEGGGDDDDDAICPKVTDKESLKPRHINWDIPAGTGLAKPLRASDDGEEPTLPLNSNVNRIRIVGMRPLDGMYSLESWEYGDTTKAKPGQLPQGFDGSRGADLLSDPDAFVDKNELLKRLAGEYLGKRKSPYDGAARREPDDTNPIFINVKRQPTCAITHRLEDEGFVKRTIYSTDYINQQRLPELPPANRAGRADVRDTNTNAVCTAGEMSAGLLTRDNRRQAALRNSHGTLLKRSEVAARAANGGSVNNNSINNNGVDLAAVETMRAMEKVVAVERGDPHAHKLHK